MGRAALRRLVVAATAVTIVVTGDGGRHDVALVALFPFAMLLFSLRRRWCPATAAPEAPSPGPQDPAGHSGPCTPPRSSRRRRPPHRRGGSAPRSRQPAGRP
jgi:hypothetical protein